MWAVIKFDYEKQVITITNSTQETTEIFEDEIRLKSLHEFPTSPLLGLHPVMHPTPSQGRSLPQAGKFVSYKLVPKRILYVCT